MKLGSYWIGICTLFFLLSACSSGSRVPEVSKKDRVQALIDIAIADITENDSTGALVALAQVKDLDDTLPQEYYLFALAYLQKNEIKMATDSARYALKLNPKYSAAKNTLGKLLLDQGKYEESEKYLLEAANDLLFREASIAKLNLGILHFKKTNLEKSSLWLTRSIDDKGPLDCLAHFYRAKVRLAQNDLLLAERDFALSMKDSCSGSTDAHLGYAQTLVREKKYDQARAKFIEIQRLFPSSDASDQAAQYLRDIP